MPRRLWLLIISILLPASGWAASFSCDKPGTQVEVAICANPELSAADERLAHAYEDALHAVADPDAARAAQRDWAAARGKVAPKDLVAFYAARTAILEDLAARPAAPALARACIRVPDLNRALTCAVTETGGVSGAHGTLRYQIQAYPSPDQQTAEAVVVLAPDGADSWKIVASAGDESAHYDAPLIITHASGTLLRLRGWMEGTGNLSAEALFISRDGAWRKIDIDAWQSRLAAQLPKGLGVWKGVYPDYRTMTASTPLWRASDGNCCPSGGRADVRLRLQNDKLVLESVRVRRDAINE